MASECGPMAEVHSVMANDYAALADQCAVMATKYAAMIEVHVAANDNMYSPPPFGDWTIGMTDLEPWTEVSPLTDVLQYVAMDEEFDNLGFNG